MTENTNWWAWDGEKKGFSFQKTEDHIFAPYHNGGQRIGDMSREELIAVIATGYHDREQLAVALLHVVANDGKSTADISDALRTAQLIVDRLNADGKSGVQP